ncbi:hypothetical protein O181_000218 [Austropuccinia psidii MF-1]|uniref:Uncharacterized protein n=1 Tax=Austropuccinia psidii MF-1 TaxID=1389203 RepID=A0A9Q3B861_9BASI|nr:hypothetical protein [Austropuccinia psidii MF-1]
MTPVEVEEITSYNQMDLHQEIQFINPKDMNVSPEDARTSTSSQISELPTSRSKNIPVSVQELVYGSKSEGVGTSAQLINRDSEFLPSSEEALGPRKYTRTYENVENYVLQGTGPRDKSLVENPKHFVRGSEERVVPKEGQQPCGSSLSLNKRQKKASKTQRITRRERESPSVTRPTSRATELQRKKKLPFKMCSICEKL